MKTADSKSLSTEELSLVLLKSYLRIKLRSQLTILPVTPLQQGIKLNLRQLTMHAHTLKRDMTILSCLI